MEYIITQVSGKQFLLQPNQWYDIDLIRKSITGDFILFNKILLFKKNTVLQLGQPFLSNSNICGEVLREVKGKKITVLKTKPKKKYTRTKGHRALYTRIKISVLNSLQN